MKFINGKTNYDEWYAEKDLNHNTERKLEVVNGLLGRADLTPEEEAALVDCVHLVKLDGKLNGYNAVSTSVARNPLCQCRARIEGAICADCYAAASVSNYDGLAQALDINYTIFNAFLISEQAWKRLEIPSINATTRQESHGDTATVTDARNKIRIMRSHPWLTFGTWTKNPGIWRNAFKEEGGKPDNMIFTLSSLFKNRPATIPQGMEQYIDHIFTVYTLDYVLAHNVPIHCGLSKCKECMICYDRNNKQLYVNELLKADQKKYKKMLAAGLI